MKVYVLTRSSSLSYIQVVYGVFDTYHKASSKAAEIEKEMDFEEWRKSIFQIHTFEVE